MTAFGPSPRRYAAHKALAPWLAAAALLALWQLASLLGWPPVRGFPAPSEVVSAAVSAAGSGQGGRRFGADLPGAAVALLLGAGLGAWRGARAVDPKLIEMGRSVGLAGWPLWRDVILPGALPALLSGARLALALFWAWRVGEETAAAGAGDGATALAPVLFYVLLALAADTLIRALARRASRWDAAAVADRAGAN